MSCQIYLILFLAFMLKELLSVSIVLKSIKEKLNMSHHHYFCYTNQFFFYIVFWWPAVVRINDDQKGRQDECCNLTSLSLGMKALGIANISIYMRIQVNYLATLMVFFCPGSGHREFSTLIWQAKGETTWEDRNMKSGKAKSKVINSKWL